MVLTNTFSYFSSPGTLVIFGVFELLLIVQLTLKEPSKIAVDDTLVFFYFLYLLCRGFT